MYICIYHIYDIILYIILYYTILYYIILYYSILYYIILYYIILYIYIPYTMSIINIIHPQLQIFQLRSSDWGDPKKRTKEPRSEVRSSQIPDGSRLGIQEPKNWSFDSDKLPWKWHENHQFSAKVEFSIFRNSRMELFRFFGKGKIIPFNCS